LPQLPKAYLRIVSNQILSDEKDHLALFEMMMENLEAELQKSFKDQILEKFRISQSPNVVNIFSKFCNLSKKSDDFEKLVTKLYETK